ncbi:MAG: LCP family protein [Oscillospiraceae bacterium]
MTKKSTKIALTYIITIIVTVAVILTVGLIVIKTTNRSGSVSDIQVTSSTEPEVYTPGVLDNQTTLFILDAEDRMTASAFVLTRLLPSEKRLVIVPLQSDMYATVNGVEGTIYDFYRSEGIQGAKRAVENVCGLTVEKYMIFDKSSFETMAAHFETVNHVFSDTLIYENEKTGEVTVIREGNCSLDPTTMRKAFTYPEYKNGETERAAVIGEIVTDFINSSNERIRTSMDQIFNAIINSGAETDITVYDYDFKKEAMQYMADNSSECAELVLPSGVYDAEGRYVLDAAFVDSLRSWFSLDIYGDYGSYEDEMPIDSSSELPAAYSAKAME